MSNSIDSILQEAYELIENNELSKARELVTPLLESNRDNPAIWWVYAHAVEDPEQGREALDHVLRLDPTYPGATDIKQKIMPTVPSRPSIKPLQQRENVTSHTDADDEWEDLEFNPEGETAQEASSGRSPIFAILVGIIVIIGIVALAGLVLSGLGGSTTPPTEIAQAPTELPTVDAQIITTEPTEEVEPTVEPTNTDLPEPTETEEVAPIVTESSVPTDEQTDSPTTSPTEEPTDIVEPTATTEATAESTSVDSNIIIAEALSDYEVTADDIETRPSPLGETYVVSVCAVPGPESSLTLNGVMDVFVAEIANLPDGIDAVAVSLADCGEEGSFTRTIGVDMETLQSFSQSTIELKDFQRKWQPLP